MVDEIDGVAIEEQADLVVASAGGTPKDIELYQSIKTLINARAAVKPPGRRPGSAGNYSWLCSDCTLYTPRSCRWRMPMHTARAPARVVYCGMRPCSAERRME